MELSENNKWERGKVLDEILYQWWSDIFNSNLKGGEWNLPDSFMNFIFLKWIELWILSFYES